MDWLTGGKQAEAKRLLAQLADSTKRDQAARDLIALDADALPVLLEALQTHLRQRPVIDYEAALFFPYRSL